MTFYEKLDSIVKKNNSLLCVGLDSDFEKLPEKFKNEQGPQFEFNKYIINQTYEFVSTFKLNSAFYEARGAQGITELKKTCEYLIANHPEIPIILDAKRADIGNTNNGYVTFAFDYLGVDAITLHPYLGSEAIKPFLERRDKGIIILCRTSNPGAGEFQDLQVENEALYMYVAKKVSEEWNYNCNCMLVVGATYPEEMKKIRNITKDMIFLVPGIGAQGGDLENTLKNGLDKNKKGLIIHSARGIIFADNPKIEAQKLRDEINIYRT